MSAGDHRPKRPAGAKTYSHLAERRRIPTEYDIATSRLLYYPAKGGFEVTTPLSAWYERYQRASPFVCDDWDAFADPRQTTYAAYTTLQCAQEAYTAGLFERIADAAHDEKLSRPCLDLLEQTIPVMRYPLHGLQMIAAYVGQMAPAGRITICMALEAADEMRQVQTLAERMALLARVRPTFGDDAKTAWTREPAWQPLREAIERALVTYDWGEAFAALNLCLKPAIDELFFVRLPERARIAGDALLGPLLGSLHADCAWHASFSRALVDEATRQRPANAEVLRAWTAKWSPLAARAVGALAPLFAGSDGSGEARRASVAPAGVE